MEKSRYLLCYSEGIFDKRSGYSFVPNADNKSLSKCSYMYRSVVSVYPAVSWLHIF